MALSVWRFFSAEAGLLEFLVLRSDAGALQPVDGNVAILFNELKKLIGKYSANPSEPAKPALTK